MAALTPEERKVRRNAKNKASWHKNKEKYLVKNRETSRKYSAAKRKLLPSKPTKVLKQDLNMGTGGERISLQRKKEIDDLLAGFKKEQETLKRLGMEGDPSPFGKGLSGKQASLKHPGRKKGKEKQLALQGNAAYKKKMAELRKKYGLSKEERDEFISDISTWGSKGIAKRKGGKSVPYEPPERISARPRSSSKFVNWDDI